MTRPARATRSLRSRPTNPSAPIRRAPRPWARWLLGLPVALGTLVFLLAPGAAARDTRAAEKATLHAGDAMVLGAVEGVTEYLPISSTGHLLVADRLLDLPEDGKAGDAVKSYDVAIQFGAILAVLLLYRRRVGAMAEGLVGRDPAGRSLLEAVAIAFVPAAIIGVAGEKFIKDVLFGVWPVAAAWAVGGVAILVLSRRGRLSPVGGRRLEALTRRDAVVIGLAQVLSLWPGTSRSLVTIVAALLVGLSMAAAVEFTFILGLATLTAATLYETVAHGSTMLDSFGVATPLLGLAVAFVTAVVAVRWMVDYLTRHDLSVFGWYRLGVAALAVTLVLSGTIPGT